MSRRAVFLDRDGVINRAMVRDGRPFPPASLSELEIPGGVPEALERLSGAGYLLIVVTNQPDVARGTIPREAVESMNALLQATLPLTEIRVCYHDSGDGCACRKPGPGMILEAAREHDIDLPESFLVGDRWRDVEAGARAGSGACARRPVGSRPRDFRSVRQEGSGPRRAGGCSLTVRPGLPRATQWPGRRQSATPARLPVWPGRCASCSRVYGSSHAAHRSGHPANADANRCSPPAPR